MKFILSTDSPRSPENLLISSQKISLTFDEVSKCVVELSYWLLVLHIVHCYRPNDDEIVSKR